MNIQDKRLLIDIGNSFTDLAIVENSDLKIFQQQNQIPFSERDKVRTSELNNHQWVQNIHQFSYIVCSSVVPKQNIIFKNHTNITFVSANTIPYLRVKVEEPSTVGADRLVNALAAYYRYRKQCLIIDSGTATTMCLVNHQGEYLGGVIFPGMGIAAKALAEYTAKIPLIKIQPQEKWIGKNTEQAVQIGLYQGNIQMLNGMIVEYRKQYPDIVVVGTGCGLEILEKNLDLDEFNPNLIIEGLYIISETLNINLK